MEPTFKTSWLALVKKYPALADKDARIEFTAANLEKLAEQFYEIGRKRGSETANSFADIFRRRGL